METAVQLEPAAPPPSTEHKDVLRYYELAKRAEWQVRDLHWNEQPPIPETTKGSPEKKARRRDMWRSVITQQYQADVFAVEMAAQLLASARHHEAKLYYSTMVQDESRHTEAWLRLLELVGGATERDPYLDELAHMFLELDSLEEKVFLMQVFFERLIIPRFRLISRSAPGTILADLCNRLTIDDGIHHRSGVAYERVLLADAPKQVQRQLVKVANQMLPIFAGHVMWRPKAREWIGAMMRTRDADRLRQDIEEGVKMASSLGIDVSDIEVPTSPL